MDLLLCDIEFCGVGAIYYEYDQIPILEVVLPKGSYFLVPSDIPDFEGCRPLRNSLHIESNCGKGCNKLTQLELVENSGFANPRQANHQDFES